MGQAFVMNMMKDVRLTRGSWEIFLNFAVSAVIAASILDERDDATEFAYEMASKLEHFNYDLARSEMEEWYANECQTGADELFKLLKEGGEVDALMQQLQKELGVKFDD